MCWTESWNQAQGCSIYEQLVSRVAEVVTSSSGSRHTTTTIHMARLLSRAEILPQCIFLCVSDLGRTTKKWISKLCRISPHLMHAVRLCPLASILIRSQ